MLHVEGNGIFCKNKLYCMAAILACLKAHKTAVLLCPEYGEAFNQKLIKKADVHNFFWRILKER